MSTTTERTLRLRWRNQYGEQRKGSRGDRDEVAVKIQTLIALQVVETIGALNRKRGIWSTNNGRSQLQNREIQKEGLNGERCRPVSASTCRRLLLFSVIVESKV